MKEIVSIREVNQHLSRYVDAIREGDEIVITGRGKPVARLIGIREANVLTEAQKPTRHRTLSRMRKGYSLGGRISNGLQELDSHGGRSVSNNLKVSPVFRIKSCSDRQRRESNENVIDKRCLPDQGSVLPGQIGDELTNGHKTLRG